MGLECRKFEEVEPMSWSLEQTTGTGIISDKGSVCTFSAIAKWVDHYSPILRYNDEILSWVHCQICYCER